MSPEGGSIERRVRNAAAAGASVIVVSGTSLPAGALDLEDGIAVPVVAVPADAGREAIEAAAEGTAATLELSAAEKLPNESLMDIAPFSSGGVAFDGRVKPDLVAPGVGLATSDAGAEGYATVTGSSAAAAVAAGAAALVVEARPGLGALELKSTLVGSGGRLRRGDDPLAVTSQGGGLVDPIHAVTSELAVEPATLAFGRADGAKWSQTRTLTIRNISSRPLSVGLGLLPDDPAGPQLSFTAQPAQLELKPGASAEVAIGVSAGDETPRALEASWSCPPTARSRCASRGPLPVARPVRLRWSATSSCRTTRSRRPPRAGRPGLPRRARRSCFGRMIAPSACSSSSSGPPTDAGSASLPGSAMCCRAVTHTASLDAARVDGCWPRAPTSSACARTRSTAMTARSRPPPRPSSRSRGDAARAPGDLLPGAGLPPVRERRARHRRGPPEVGFELEEVDITGDPELERAYRERIPVVEIDGEEAFTYFVHPDGLRRRLDP